MVSKEGEPQRGDTCLTRTHRTIFSWFSAPKEREKLIVADAAQTMVLHGGHCKELRLLVIANGGIEIHVHLLIQLPAILPLAKAICFAESKFFEVDEGTRNKVCLAGRHGAFSVSASILEAVIRYIGDQERHHRKMSFEDEFIGLLKRHWIEFDPRYVFG